MVVKQSEKVFSDASGGELDKPYRVAVLFDNKMYVVDLDRDELESELSKLTLFDVVRRGRVDKAIKRNSRRSLNSQFHHDARTWAREHGIAVGDRGIVDREVLDQYMQDTGVKPITVLIEDEQGRAQEVPAEAGAEE